MKIFHLSDLHIGKSMNYSLKNIQIDILNKIIEKVKEHNPDVVLISGDIYDKAVPSSEAFDVFDDFLVKYNKVNPDIPMLIIAGNHDDASRLNYGSEFFSNHQIYIETLPPSSQEAHIKKVTLTDKYGDVNFYLLPFTRTSMVRNWNEDVNSYNDAIKYLIEREYIDYSSRNVLLSHQFYINGSQTPERSASEINYLSVGGIDSVDVNIIKDFDYVALGHIHKSQMVLADHIRYSGTPIKYSLSEVDQTKGIQVVELNQKGEKNNYSFIELETVPAIRKIRGSLKELLALANDENKDDYLFIQLTDSEGYNPLEQLREKYSHIIEVVNINNNIKDNLELLSENERELDPTSAFEEFYKQIKSEDISKKSSELFADILLEVTSNQGE